jgi:hypothetical protein
VFGPQDIPELVLVIAHRRVSVNSGVHELPIVVVVVIAVFTVTL